MTDEVTRTNSLMKIAILPLILGAGAFIWLGVYIDAHYFRKELSQEERANQEVGANPLPIARIHIVPNKPEDRCLKIEKAFLDGQYLSIYFRNMCHMTVGNYEIKVGWQGVAPDGTVITSAEHYTGIKNLDSGRRAEFIAGGYRKFDDDARIVELDVWVKE